MPEILSTFADGSCLKFDDGELLVTTLVQYYDAPSVQKKSVESWHSHCPL